jgi:hypothetical protein
MVQRRAEKWTSVSPWQPAPREPEEEWASSFSRISEQVNEVKDKLAKDKRAKGKSAKSKPAEGSAAEGTPSKSKSSKSKPAEGTPVKSKTTKSNLSKVTSEKGTPGKSKPAKASLAEDIKVVKGKRAAGQLSTGGNEYGDGNPSGESGTAAEGTPSQSQLSGSKPAEGTSVTGAPSRSKPAKNSLADDIKAVKVGRCRLTPG